MEKYNFIVLAPNRWEGVWMNRQHLFSIIGNKHNVIYTNAPFYYWDKNLARFKSAPFFGKAKKINNIFNIEFPKFLLRIPKISSVDRFIKKLFIKKIQSKLDSNLRTILYIFNPIYGEYVKDIHHDFLIYHPYDDFENLYSDNIAKNGEQVLLANANVIFTTSKALQKSYRQKFKNPNNVYFVPNGVDFDVFSNIRNNIEDIEEKNNRPKIGYTGSINAKIDISLLYNIFSELTDCDFYVTGSEGKIDSFQNDDLKNLKSLPNVYFLGNKKLVDVPSYMNAMDVNIIPYRTDPDSFANSGYPLKLHEYLAIGKPIICSPIESVFEFEDVVSIKCEVNEWISEIRRLIHCENGKLTHCIERRQNVAKANTWKERTEIILEIISKEYKFKVSN